MWPAFAIAGSAVSLILLVAFWGLQLIFGVAIDIALIAAAVTRPEWTDRLTS